MGDYNCACVNSDVDCTDAANTRASSIGVVYRIITEDDADDNEYYTDGTCENFQYVRRFATNMVDMYVGDENSASLLTFSTFTQIKFGFDTHMGAYENRVAVMSELDYA